MDPDVIGVRGDGIGTPFFRDGSGTARVTILADCRTLQETVLERPTFTVTTTRRLQSVQVELAEQTVTAPRVGGGQGTGTFSATIFVGGTAGMLVGRVVATGSQTQRRTLVSPPGTTTTVSQWTTPVSFTSTVVADTTPPTIQLVSLDPQADAVAGQTLRLAVTDTQSGLRDATWEIVGAGGGRLEPDGGGHRAAVDWRSVTGTPGTVPAPTDLPVVIRARDAAVPIGNEATLAQTLHDAVAPTLRIDTPADDAVLIGDATGATVTFSGSVADHWSGVTSLTLSVDDAPAVDLRPGQPTVTEAAWSHVLQLPDFRRHQVVVRARDAAGNDAGQTRTVGAELLGPGQWLDVGAPSTTSSSIRVVEVLGLLDLWDHPTLTGLHLAVRGDDDRLWTARFDGRDWQWTDHHAGLGPTSSPVVLRGAGAVVGSSGSVPFAAVQSTVGRLWIRWYSGADWQWTDRGRPPAIPIAAPVGIVTPAADTGPTVVVQGNNGQLWFQRWVANWVGLNDPAGRHIDPPLVGVTTVGSPSGERLVAVVCGDDGHAWSVDLGTAAWADLGAPDAGVTPSGPVGTTRSGEGSFRAFVTGSDGHLWVVDVDGSATRWMDLGLPPGSGISAGGGVRPALTTVRRSLAHVIGSDGRLWVAAWDGTTFDWHDRGAPTGQVAVGGAPTATCGAARLGSGMPLRHIALTCTPDGHAWLHHCLDE